MLIDPINKRIDYLRISVTDRCNLRCLYCMPREGIVSRPQQEILTFEEILRLVKIFSWLGVRKVRLTGGEPLARKGLVDLINNLVKIEGIEEVCLTTNGTLLSSYAEDLKQAGLSRINISLDTLKKDRFKKITKSDSFYNIIEGIDKAKSLNFHPLKLNMVVMKNINDDEIIDFVDFARSKGLILRFIEFMKVTPLWREDSFMPIERIKDICRKRLQLERLGRLEYGPAVYYRTEGDGMLGFIKTDEKSCEECTRLRLTSTGELKICLYETQGFRLRDLLRLGVCDEEIRDIIKAKMELKQYTDYRKYESEKLYMCSIGG